MRNKGLLCVPPISSVLFPIIVLFTIATSAVAAPPKRPAPNQPCAAWRDDFSASKVDTSRWVIANGQAPGYIPGVHIGYYQPDHVSIDNGYLRIELTQAPGTVDGSAGIISRGGLIYTKAQCGYGTYQWTMRMSSSSDSPMGTGSWYSGSVSAGFVYVNNSQTEIDFEYSATTPDYVWQVNWLNPNPRRDPTEANETATREFEPDAVTDFHTYTFVWTAGNIAYYIDGNLASVHTTNVPTAPAYFMINHWGTDGPNWGGVASPGATRYFYIDSASFTPIQ